MPVPKTQHNRPAVALSASLRHCCPCTHHVHLILSSPVVVTRWTQAVADRKATRRNGSKDWADRVFCSFFAEVHHNPLECTQGARRLCWRGWISSNRTTWGQSKGPGSCCKVVIGSVGTPGVVTVAELSDPSPRLSVWQAFYVPECRFVEIGHASIKLNIKVRFVGEMLKLDIRWR